MVNGGNASFRGVPHRPRPGGRMLVASRALLLVKT
jgi:hypothetical protein